MRNKFWYIVAFISAILGLITANKDLFTETAILSVFSNACIIAGCLTNYHNSDR